MPIVFSIPKLIHYKPAYYAAALWAAFLSFWLIFFLTTNSTSGTGATSARRTSDFGFGGSIICKPRTSSSPTHCNVYVGVCRCMSNWSGVMCSVVVWHHRHILYIELAAVSTRRVVGNIYWVIGLSLVVREHAVLIEQFAA